MQDLTLSHSLCSSHTVLLSVPWVCHSLSNYFLAAKTGSKIIFMKIERTTRRGKIYQEGIWLSRVLEKEIWKRTERGDIFKRNNRRQIPWPKEEKTESNFFLFLYCFCFIQGWLFSFNPSAFLSCCLVQFSSVQSLSHVWLFATPWIAACQASLSITNSRSLLKPTSIESVMPSNHLILCRPLLLLPPIPPSIRVFSNESTLHMRWPKYWSFTSASVLPMDTQDWSPLG